ncbi:hypothetical protein HDU85_001119 [Gaertneriomyces sp. JEL0708]|nr:hypothetical protein HDU85_001119 [Gaertneriomyces sp. JEL0708]
MSSSLQPGIEGAIASHPARDRQDLPGHQTFSRSFFGGHGTSLDGGSSMKFPFSFGASARRPLGTVSDEAIPQDADPKEDASGGQRSKSPSRLIQLPPSPASSPTQPVRAEVQVTLSPPKAAPRAVGSVQASGRSPQRIQQPVPHRSLTPSSLNSAPRALYQLKPISHESLNRMEPRSDRSEAIEESESDLVLLASNNRLRPTTRGRVAGDLGFLGNIDMENQLASTMMDLAKNIQAQNSTRQQRLEELTEELTQARACMQEQADAIIKLRENSQIVVQAIVTERETASRNHERIEKLKRSCQLYKMTIQNLAKLIKDHEADKNDIEHRIQRATQECQALLDERGKLEASMATKEEDFKNKQLSLEREVQSCIRARDALEEQLNDAKTRLKSLQEDFERKNREHKTELQQHQDAAGSIKAALEAERDRLMEELAEAKNSYFAYREQATSDAADAKVELAALREKINASEARERSLADMKARLENDVTNMTEKVDALEQKLRESGEERATLAAFVEESKNAIQYKESEWRKQQAELKRQLEDAEKRGRDTQAEVSRLQRELADERDRFAFEVNALKSLKTNIDEKHAENIAALEQIRESQYREIERLSKSSDALQTAVDQMRAERKQLEDQHVQALEEAHRATQESRSAYEHQLREAEKNRSSLAGEISRLEMSLADAANDKIVTSREHEREMQQHVKRHEAECARLQQELEAVREQLKELENKYKSAESVSRELFDMKPKHATLVKRIKSLEEDLASREVDLANAQREVGTIRQRMATADAQREEMREAFAAEKERLTKQMDELKVERDKFQGETLHLREEIAAVHASIVEARMLNEQQMDQLKRQFDAAEKRRESDKTNLQAKVNALRQEREQLSGLTKELQSEKADLELQLINKIKQNEELLAVQRTGRGPHSVTSVRDASAPIIERLTLDEVDVNGFAGLGGSIRQERGGQPLDFGRTTGPQDDPTIVGDLRNVENQRMNNIGMATDQTLSGGTSTKQSHKKFRCPLRAASLKLTTQSTPTTTETTLRQPSLSLESGAQAGLSETQIRSETTGLHGASSSGKHNENQVSKPERLDGFLQPQESFSFSQIEMGDAIETDMDHYALEELVMATLEDEEERAVENQAPVTGTTDFRRMFSKTSPEKVAHHDQPEATLVKTTSPRAADARVSANVEDRRATRGSQNASETKPTNRPARRTRSSGAILSEVVNEAPKTRGIRKRKPARYEEKDEVDVIQQDSPMARKRRRTIADEPKRDVQTTPVRSKTKAVPNEDDAEWSQPTHLSASRTKSKMSTRNTRMAPLAFTEATSRRKSPGKDGAQKSPNKSGSRRATKRSQSPSASSVSSITTTTVVQTQRVYQTKQRREKNLSRSKSVRVKEADSSRRQLTAFDPPKQANMNLDDLFGWPAS